MNDIEYIKRYRMVFDFENRKLVPRPLPKGFYWVPWRPALLETHARLQFEGFRNELDSYIFPTFTRYDLCLRLMRQIAAHPDCLANATWLVATFEQNSHGPVYCATIQGLKPGWTNGSIQNVAVLSPWRKQGLGHALVTRALEGFRQAGCRQVTLEATAENLDAIAVYQGIGFVVQKTTYKETFMTGTRCSPPDRV